MASSLLDEAASVPQSAAVSRKILPKITIADNPSEVFSTRFSPDGKFLAAGCGDGAIRVFKVSNGALCYSLNVGKVDGLPTTSLRFRPNTSASKTKNVLLAVNSEGTVQHWHITSGKCLHEIREENNQCFAVDYRNDAQLFATAGKDYAVRIYDEATKTLVSTMKGGFAQMSPGHSNRVFSLKFNPTDPNLLVSGGWDNTVQIWDLRVEHSVKSIYGPFICGDAVDVFDNTVLTGSWRPEKPLELWDFATGKMIETIPWHQSSIHGDDCQLYAAQFSKGDASMIAAGGSGSNEAKIFDRTKGNQVIGTVAGLSRGVFTLDFNHDGSQLAVAGGDAAIRLFDIQASASTGGKGVADTEAKSTSATSTEAGGAAAAAAAAADGLEEKRQ